MPCRKVFGLFCCVCFGRLTPDTCAVDEQGSVWDTHKGDCARQAGIVEADRQPTPEKPIHYVRPDEGR